MKQNSEIKNSKSIPKGCLVISLDFELLWGVFDVVDLKRKKDYFMNTRAVIPEILQLFTTYEIRATWATVGMLFNHNWKEWEENIPEEIPHYENRKLSAYQFGKSIKSDSTEKFCFAPDIIEKIIETNGQEIGSHTYSHYYCSEPGQTVNEFGADLQKAREIAEPFGVSMESLVFPRNQINPEHLLPAKQAGFTTVRSNPVSWFWKNPSSNNLLTKMTRTGDAYFDLASTTYSLYREQDISPLEQKASRFLRPVENFKLLRSLKLRRILKEMESAAKKQEVYHLWWHPHNFGSFSKESLEELKIIIHHFQELRLKFGFDSRNMRDVYALHIQRNSDIISC